MLCNMTLSVAQCIYSAEDITKIQQILVNTHKKWFIIGKKLRISIRQLQIIQKQHGASTKKCLEVLIGDWLAGSPKLGQLIAVLKLDEINFIAIAEKLQGNLMIVCMFLFHFYLWGVSSQTCVIMYTM